ncbi:hypothetical protein R1sor_021574 [Riccia sorocarpa]|uniref:Uncharacterized protein n=1 Tax=Riccia sorocarpa TaxID=122646 RepID=A0ABD3GHG8_9MARC
MERLQFSVLLSSRKSELGGLFCPVVVLIVLQHVIVLVSSLDARSAFLSEPSPPTLVVLGDSTVDVGVNNRLVTLVKSNFPPYGRDFEHGIIKKQPTGRFCNGKIVPDYLAEKLGIPYPLAYTDPQATGTNILQGINVASSGSGWYNSTAATYNVKPLHEQVEWVNEWQKKLVSVIGQEAAAMKVKEAVYIISTGSNDWVNYYYTFPGVQSSYSKSNFRKMILIDIANILQLKSCIVYVKDQLLYGSGARRILLTSLPPLGCIPSQITKYGEGTDRNCVSWIQDDVTTFNRELEELIASLKNTLPEATLVMGDGFSITFDAFQNPAKYDLQEVKKGCCGTGLYEVGLFCTTLQSDTTCRDASHYLFWDSFHPSHYFNTILAEEVWQTIVKRFQLTVT